MSLIQLRGAHSQIGEENVDPVDPDRCQCRLQFGEVSVQQPDRAFAAFQTRLSLLEQRLEGIEDLEQAPPEVSKADLETLRLALSFPEDRHVVPQSRWFVSLEPMLAEGNLKALHVCGDGFKFLGRDFPAVPQFDRRDCAPGTGESSRMNSLVTYRILVG